MAAQMKTTCPQVKDWRQQVLRKKQPKCPIKSESQHFHEILSILCSSKSSWDLAIFWKDLVSVLKQWKVNSFKLGGVFRNAQCWGNTIEDFLGTSHRELHKWKGYFGPEEEELIGSFWKLISSWNFPSFHNEPKPASVKWTEITFWYKRNSSLTWCRQYNFVRSYMKLYWWPPND